MMDKNTLKGSTVPMFEEQASIVGGAGELAIHRKQHVPQEYIDHLRDQRFHSTHTPAGEMHRICSIPEALYNTWKRQGFDVLTATAPEIIARLKAEGYDDLITTNKKIGR